MTVPPTPESPESPSPEPTNRRQATAPYVLESDPARATQRRVAITDQLVRQFVINVAKLVSDLHGQDVLVLDVRGLSDLTDYVLIASGTSAKQISALGDRATDLASEAGLSRYGQQSDKDTNWLVVDFVDVIVHLFEPDTRAHYDLEMLWGDAPKVEWAS